MNFYLSLALAMCFVLMGASQEAPAAAPVEVSTPGPTPALLGGWSILDPKDAEAKKAARYAVSTTYPSGKTTMRVVSAKCQIVSGWNYDLNVAVTFIGNRSCSMQNYVVWKVGDPNAPSPYKVTKQTALTSQKCKSK